QPHGQELVDTLRMAMADALNAYQEHNGTLPTLVLVYRDGVGRSQLERLRTVEIAGIRAAFGDFADYHPPLAVIVVHKRVNRRLFELTGDGTWVNPRPGVTCPGIATELSCPSFYLVSQATRTGSALPTHYVVAENTTPLTQEDLERATFQLAHLYFNWAGTIKTPAPVAYAHRVALLCGQAKIQEIPPSWRKTYYFL
ncbi:MAG TPA: Piwi domain-containing protein, partial [Candidatus Lokiarchaeia archaeon]|nr:Piwi domain-containing protein [Candidatus Lokiarchaeia archaeon]